MNTIETIKVGTVERCPALDTEVADPTQVEIIGGKKIITFDAGATVDVGVHVSRDAILLIALPCLLSIEKARELANILQLTIRQTKIRSINTTNDVLKKMTDKGLLEHVENKPTT